jgi:cytochrome P450
MRGKQVPAGASVVVSPWLIHRHRTLWPSPDEFDPDRFDRSDTDSSDGNKQAIRSAYLPFGLGPRVCIGAAFAQQEAALILGMVAQHFRLVPVAGLVPEPVGRLTIRAENGIHLQVFSRSDT